MAKFVCKYCGLGPAIYEKKGPHIGEWCSFCKRWIRWVPKTEVSISQPEKEVPTEDTIVNQHRLDYEESLLDEVPWYE